MKIDIDEIIYDCLNNLDLEDEDGIHIDDIYDEAHDAVEEIIGDISSGIISELEKRNIEITYWGDKYE